MRALFAIAILLAPAPSVRAQEGHDAIERYGCASCHALDGFAVSERASCTGCHQRIVSAPRSGLGRAPSVSHYVHVPEFARVARRLRTDYLERFVRDPHDVRPRLEETMPRLPVSEEDARAIVRLLRESAGPTDVPASPAPSEANVERGRAVLAASGCPVCHEVGNETFDIHLPPAAIAGMGEAAYEAPNLRFVRERMDPDVALAWIRDPRSIDPDTRMRDPELSDADSIAVRDYLFLGEHGAAVAAAPPPSPASIEPSARPVRFAEVRRIFNRSCIHCHSHAVDAGTFGFEPGALDLSSAAGARAGVRLADGSSRSVIEPGADGVPPLVARLMRRHAEAPRDLVLPHRDPMTSAARAIPDEPVGMPLGLPPLPIDDVCTIASWIAQGARD